MLLLFFPRVFTASPQPLGLLLVMPAASSDLLIRQSCCCNHQGYSSVSTEKILAGLQVIDKDTFYGHTKFSYRQTNIGQSPVVTQRQVRGNDS